MVVRMTGIRRNGGLLGVPEIEVEQNQTHTATFA
jgi:hypothetical protein